MARKSHSGSGPISRRPPLLDTDAPNAIATIAPVPVGASLRNSLSNVHLTLLVALVLFVMAAWPLLLVTLPPFQDLPNHVATAHIVAHPDLYPEYAFNGYFKSNCLLTLWFQLFGDQHLFGAARAFTALVLAMNALALPLFVLHFSGSRALPVAMLFVWPLVHSFFVVMGFLNFAFAFAVALILLVVLDRQRAGPTLARAAAIAALSMLLWYAHVFPLMVVAGLVILHTATLATWRIRFAACVALLLPLAPAVMLSLVSTQRHLVKAEHATTQVARTFSFLSSWQLVAHLWTDVSGAFTLWGSATLIPALLLPLFAWKQRRVERPFFSLRAMVILFVAYVGLPEMMSNWHYLNCRLVPFLWAGLSLRLPTTLPRRLTIILATCAVLFSVVTGVDYARLDRDRATFTSGIDAVPQRATLLPLLFQHRKTSLFTASLTHAWGFYTVAKDTSAPLVFAVERSYPITYRDFPPRALIPPALDNFAESCGTPAKVCELLHQRPSDAACTSNWRDLWRDFWREAEPRFTHVLTWAIPAEVRPLIPARYHRVFATGELEIYARDTAVGSGP
jgi:hypothetical protein